MSRLSPARLACAAALLLALAGCADRSGFPSLAPRPVEREGDAPPAAPAPVAATRDAALDAQAADLAAQASAGDATFAKTAASTCASVAKGLGAAQGSEAWIAAQQALSAIEAARGPVKTALAQLDQLLVERADATGGAVDTDRLLAAEQQVSALDAAEQARATAIAAGDCSG